jgi:hypothetical protein
MTGKELKQKLIAERHNVNYIYYEKIMEHIADHDSVGLDHQHFIEALKWVPNHVLRRWIKKMKERIKEGK